MVLPGTRLKLVAFAHPAYSNIQLPSVCNAMDGQHTALGITTRIPSIGKMKKCKIRLMPFADLGKSL